ncbi:MAG TPA: metallophosphoesterase N-terminal domain-containing protein, partial [Gemmatirosa sp.]|nr:metallophosphoesterase N-terminal domain-containing protein [Gemmatirosa sp.]
MLRRSALRELLRGTAAAAIATLGPSSAAAAVARDLARATGTPSPRDAAPTRPAAPVRVRGRVTDARGRGVARVAVSDGLSVAITEADGRYTLVSDGRRRHVFVTVPAGYALPGTAHRDGTLVRADRPIVADARGDAQARFALVPVAAPETHHRLLLLADPQTQNAFEMGRLHAE